MSLLSRYYGSRYGYQSTGERTAQVRRLSRQAQRNMAIQARRSPLAVAAKARGRVGTKTRTMTKKKPGYAVVGMGECTDSFFKMRSHRLSGALMKVLKTVPVHTINATPAGAQVVIPDGAQDMTVIGTFMDNGQFDSLVSTTTSSAHSSIIAYLGGKCTAMITNHGSSTIKIKLYDVLTKRDYANGAVNAILDGVDQAGGSATSYTDIGVVPKNSPEYRCFKKTLKVTLICLAPGQTHNHHINYDVHRLWNANIAANTAEDYIGGWTLEVLAISQGVAACDSTGANVTTSDGQYNYIFTRQSSFKIIDRNISIHTYSSSLPTKGSITTRLYNTDTSAVGNVDTTD